MLVEAYKHHIQASFAFPTSEMMDSLLWMIC